MRERVGRLGGRLILRSAPGDGTAVVVALEQPVDARQQVRATRERVMTTSRWGEPGTRLAPARLAEAEAAGGAADDISILIADDHEVVREGLVAMIDRQPGMRVVAQAGDGAQAAALWSQHRPDITLVDLRMPSSTASA